MGRFPWDSHRNDIPMDKSGYLGHVSKKVEKHCWNTCHTEKTIYSFEKILMTVCTKVEITGKIVV